MLRSILMLLTAISTVSQCYCMVENVLSQDSLFIFFSNHLNTKLRLISFPEHIKPPLRRMDYYFNYSDSSKLFFPSIQHSVRLFDGVWEKYDKTAINLYEKEKQPIRYNVIEMLRKYRYFIVGDYGPAIKLTVHEKKPFGSSTSTHLYEIYRAYKGKKGYWLSMEDGIGWLDTLSMDFSFYPCELVSFEFFLKSDSIVAVTQNGVLIIPEEQTKSFFNIVEFNFYRRKLGTMLYGSDCSIEDKFNKTAKYLLIYYLYKNRLRLGMDEEYAIRKLFSRNITEIDTIKELLLKMTNDTLKTELLEFFLIPSFTLIGEPDSALKYLEAFRRKYPDSQFNSYIQDATIDLLKKASNRIDSIKRGNFSPDERLWLLGNAYFEMYRNDWNAGEVYWDMTYPFSYYKKLIERYPKSIFSDDAEYKMLEYVEIGSHEGGDNGFNLEAIDLYKKLLLKYPKTNKKPDILLRIGCLYYGCTDPWCASGEKQGDVESNVKNAKMYLKKVIKLFPKTQQAKKAIRMLEEIDQRQ